MSEYPGGGKKNRAQTNLLMYQTPERILIIRFSSVGDIVLSSLLVRVLRNRFPHSAIDYLVKEEFADLVRYNPHVSRLLVFPNNGTFRDLHTLRHQIRQEGYDLLIDIHGSLRSHYLCLGTSHTVRIHKRKFARFLLVKFKWNAYQRLGGAPSVAHRYVETVQDYGIEDDRKGLELFLPVTAQKNVTALLESAGKPSYRLLIGVCPAAKHWNKMWLQERFADTAARLSNELDAGIVLFGSGKEEEDRVRAIEEQIHLQSQGTFVINCAGKLPLTDVAAMMDHCALVLSNDSGLMHIAAARKRRVVAIFGPTVRELGFFPFGTQSTVVEQSGLGCRPCTHVGLPRCPKRHFKCMNDLSVSDVVAAARSLLEG
jgi:lipopolysaccharide heptosyltransferase II